MTKEENNIRLAQWVFADRLQRANVCPICEWKLEHNVPWYHHCAPPDFYLNEEANALLLDKMPEPELWLESNSDEPKLWGCTADMLATFGAVFDADRKAAIVEAALRLIEREKGKDSTDDRL